MRPLHPMTRVLAPDLVVLETRVAEVERELAAARAEADRCVAEARDEAAAIVAAAEAEQDEIERRMRAEALAAAESGIRSLVESLRAEETSRRDDFPREVAEAALAMCRALLSHASAATPTCSWR
ncbi:MAG: hypothetical protein R3F20_13585 [Planctomycetota bacterium]